jgi:hypothetical protein
MEERANHLTVVIGASCIAEELRRTLVQHDVAHAGVSTHLRGLRKSMVLGENDLVVVCIALDRATLTRHGKAVRQLLCDHRCSPQPVRSVGLLTEIGLDREAAELGCDVYVDDSDQATKAIALLARRWQRSQSKAPASRSRISDTRSMQPYSWLWGTDQMPSELVPLLTSRTTPLRKRTSSNITREPNRPSE